MKIKSTLMLLVAMVVTVTFTSCEKEHEENPYIQLTKELHTKYKSFVIGDWKYEEESDMKKETVFLSLREDGSMYYHDVYNKREEVMIGGVPTLTDWKTVLDEEESGHWSLRYNEHGPCLILTVRYSDNAANSIILRFESADETELICQGITVGNFVTYRRVSGIHRKSI
ncbi:MAG: hypothetical protein IKH01_12225 [Prevotella sp.]|nr:hypothetical protein [Prevotella sp.]